MSAAPYRCLLRVRYGDCDAQNVVFNARYGDYIDVAVTEFIRALGFAEDFVQGGLDYQLVRQSIEWRAPARFDEIIAADIHVSHIGTTSFRLRTDFLRATDGTALATAETIYVCVTAELAKREIPEAFRSALEKGAPGRVHDLAGTNASR
ncbi:acyl-CoA thioesterase [Algiphilus aromaticivorans]|jgi:acyl-CoA thioester hydrolase|uniref:acyl-CoA thioesterase n=1 Tax=Algiphilus aromaticivorans TaxID=382454 RepID=UPI0005C12FB2|nr:acyl-CoA thioesterase [Algiphilus aromaticivorans]